MKFSYLVYSALIFIITGCSGGSSTSDSNNTPATQAVTVSGGGVKGPMAHAIVSIYQVDYSQTDLKGTLLTSGTTNSSAQISGISLSQTLSGYIIVQFEANSLTTDITSGSAPLFDSLHTVVTAASLINGMSVYATPLTTLAANIAIANADKPSPFSGNNNGSTTEEEFEAALSLAQSQVKSTLGFGLDSELDIFSVPPLLTSATDTTDEQSATAAYRQANEALAALTAEISNTSSADETAQDIFEALAEDLKDGEIDGQNDGSALPTLTALDQTISTELATINIGSLKVPGTDTLVSDIQAVLINETTATETTVDTEALSQGDIMVVLGEISLISDSDGDGIADDEDAFPLDNTETLDSDEDGVGDNSDVFPSNPNESADSDQDEIGDNADAFPNDPSESIDSDEDGVGDNADIFPNDPNESADSDSDEVGDNADVFPNDASETQDTDNDGVGDNADAFPEDETESVDTDEDGVGDNSDAYPEDPEKSVLDAIELSMWLGQSLGTLSMPSSANGIEVYSSNDVDCDIANYFNCTNGEYNLFVGQDFTNDAAQSDRSAYHHIVTDTQSSMVDVGTSRWSKRKNTQVVVFNDRMWVIAGYDSQGQNQEVWSSQDGDTWVQVTDQAAFGERFDHSVAVFNNKMWLIGGTRYAENAATIRLNDIWSSSDGKNWTLENDTPPFPLRSSASLLAFQDKLWMMTGLGADYAGTNDVWYSENGVDWTEATSEAPWEALTYTNLIHFNNQMMLIGGGGLYEKVWTSTNGVDWTEQETNYPPRNVSTITVHNNKVWLTGGYSNSGYLNDVWVSDDGLTYTEVDSSYFFKRAEVGFVSFNDRLWIIGGRQGLGYGDVMSSEAGVNWIRHNFGPKDMRPRYYHSLTGLNDKLFILGGSSFSGDESIWSSEDGLRWDKIVETAPFDTRYNLKSIAFNDKLFLYGGILNDGVNTIHAKNDIWSTTNGVQWTQETEAAEFSERASFGLTEWNGKLWIVGGWTQRSESELNDVWSSSDGIHWTLETSEAAFPARRGHALVTINNTLYLIGGQSRSTNYEDIWSSSDGINWTQEPLSTTALFRPRDTGTRLNFQAIAHNNKIFVVSGTDSAGVLSDVWSSSNGTTWVQESADTGMHGRIGFTMTTFDDDIWLHGGVYTDGISYYLKDVWRSSNGADWQVGFHKEGPLTTE